MDSHTLRYYFSLLSFDIHRCAIVLESEIKLNKKICSMHRLLNHLLGEVLVQSDLNHFRHTLYIDLYKLFAKTL